MLSAAGIHPPQLNEFFSEREAPLRAAEFVARLEACRRPTKSAGGRSAHEAPAGAEDGERAAAAGGIDIMLESRPPAEVAKGDFQAPPGAVRGRSCDDPALHLRETGMPSVGQDRSTQHAISKLTFQSDYFGGAVNIFAVSS